MGSLGGKQVELLKEIAPRVARVTLLFNPPTATFVEGYLNPLIPPLPSLGAEAIVAPVNDMPGVESPRYPQRHASQVSGLVVIPDAFTGRHRAEITALAARYHVPAVSWSRSFAEVGGLISYGPISSMSTDVRRRTPTAFSRARNRASFPSRPQSSSSS